MKIEDENVRIDFIKINISRNLFMPEKEVCQDI